MRGHFSQARLPGSRTTISQAKTTNTQMRRAIADQPTNRPSPPLNVSIRAVYGKFVRRNRLELSGTLELTYKLPACSLAAR